MGAIASKIGATAATTAKPGLLSMKGLDSLVELVEQCAGCRLPRLEQGDLRSALGGKTASLRASSANGARGPW